MTVYIAICLDGKCDWSKRQAYLDSIYEISQKIKESGIEVVNLNTTGVKEYPNPGIFECVRYAGIVVCICGEVSLGFGDTVLSAMRRLPRWGVAFVPEGGNLDLGLDAHQYQVRSVSFRNTSDIVRTLTSAQTVPM